MPDGVQGRGRVGINFPRRNLVSNGIVRNADSAMLAVVEEGEAVRLVRGGGKMTTFTLVITVPAFSLPASAAGSACGPLTRDRRWVAELGLARSRGD